MRASWHEERRTGLGGSDMPSILGVCPFGGTPLGVWRAKVGLTAADDKSSPDIKRGVFLEPIIRRIYHDETGNTVEHSDALMRHPVETWAIAHLDGTIAPKGDDSGVPKAPGILEIKAPRIRGFVNLEEDGVPANYQIQVQHYMGVTGYQWADFVAWNADCFRLLIVRIERDQSLIDLIFDHGRDFWNRHVMTGIPPSEEVAPVLRMENLSPTVKRLDSPEWQEAATQWIEAKEIEADATQYAGRCREHLIKIAARESAAKVRGGGVSLTVGKNGIVSIRHGKQEITA
jgi:putative phage-type endonuclease